MLSSTASLPESLGDLLGSEPADLDTERPELKIGRRPPREHSAKSAALEPEEEGERGAAPVDLALGEPTVPELAVDPLEPADRVTVDVESELVGPLAAEAYFGGVQQSKERRQPSASGRDHQRRTHGDFLAARPGNGARKGPAGSAAA